jgi:ABC-type antimicrobial peptide transport system permease subunit
MEIIGVVSALPQPDPETPSAPLFYVPYEQNPRAGMALMVRPRGPTTAATSAIRAAVWAVDADQPVYDVRTMEEIFDDAVAGGNAITSLLSSFAFFALVMAAAGIYGVMSVLVTQRTREFGIRMALGADSREVRKMVLRGSAALVLGGAAVGALGGYALASILASGLSEVDPFDPAVYAVVTVVLTLVALASVWQPTRRATRVDPLIALSTE